MENKFTAGENTMKTRKAFTLTELVVGIMVMAITYAAMSLSSSAAKQTAQHEAERLAAYIFRTIQKADRIHKGFNMEVATDSTEGYQYIKITWNEVGAENSKNVEDSFKVSAGCRYENFPSLTYNEKNKQFNSGYTIVIIDSEGKEYYVIIASTEGRIYTSETKP